MSITLTAQQYLDLVGEIQAGQTDIVTIGIHIGLSVDEANGEAFRQFVSDAIGAFRGEEEAELFRVCMGREPDSTQELDGAMGRVESFVDALRTGDEGAVALVKAFVDHFNSGPELSPALLRPAPKPRSQPRTVTPPHTMCALSNGAQEITLVDGSRIKLKHSQRCDAYTGISASSPSSKAKP